MNPRLIAPLIAAAGLSLSLNAIAGPKIDRIEVSAQPAVAGKPVKITVHALDVDDSVCGIQIDFGDGAKDEPQKTGGKYQKFPRTWEHTYAKPGKYTLVADGARAGTYLACVASAKFDLNVEAATAAAKAGKEVKKSPCPADWAQKGKTARDGGFTCVPAKGVKNPVKPEKGIECPAGTAYFTKGKTLGCEKG